VNPAQLPELIFSVTNHCNHACKMCYYHQTLAETMREMSLGEIERVSRSLGSIDRLWLSGGEPLLRKDLVEICKIFHRNNQLRRIFLPSNGSLPDRMAETVAALADLTPTVDVSVMFSLEGLQRTHDRIHARTGAFDSVVASVRALQRLRLGRLRARKPVFGVSMNTVVTDANAAEVPRLMDWVAENLWVDLHTFTPVRGQALDPEHGFIDPEIFAALVDDARPHFRRYLSRNFGQRDDPEVALAALEARYRTWEKVMRGGELPLQCAAGEGIGVLEPNGDVRVCELKPVVGNVRAVDHDFGAVWEAKPALDVKATVPGCACTHGCFLSATERQKALRSTLHDST